MKNRITIFFLTGLLIFLASCSTTKLVPKDDALYTGASVKVKDSLLSHKEKKKIVHLNQKKDSK